MTTLLTKKWRKYWSDKSTPMYGRTSGDFDRSYADELRVILPPAGAYRTVLELGCGSGEMFAPLGFDACEYTGVDFSQNMLDAFRARHPGVQLCEANVSEFQNGRQYDLIFSCGLVQYLDIVTLEKSLAACRRMMTTSTVVVHAGIPWSRHKWMFRRGWGPGRPPVRTNRVKRTLRPWYAMLKEQIGQWHSPQIVASIAARHGLACQFFGSIHFLYRFHALLKRCDGSAQRAERNHR